MTAEAVPFDYLDPAARAVIDRSPAERLEWFQEQQAWIPYPKATALLAQMQETILRPRKARMRGMLVIADSNNGKSRLAAECFSRNPIDENEEGEHVIMPVLLFEMPPRPDENAVLDEILTILNQPFRRTAAPGDKRRQVILVLQRCGLRALMVDEIQRILGARREMRRVIMDLLRYIASRIPVPLIAFSTPRGANALSSSDEMINRLHPHVLPPWKLDGDFRRLLASFESLLPLLQRSLLTSKHIASLIHARSEGLIGEVRDLLELSMQHAVAKRLECIDEGVIRAVSWTEPSARKRLIGVPGRE